MGCGAYLLSANALAGEPRVIATSQMELEFRDGWLTSWHNKLTDEEICFGNGRAIPEAASAEFLKADETTAALTQTGAAVWAIRLPRSGITLHHTAAGALRQRYLLLQGKSGGLLVMLDDPQLACRAALERDGATLTLRIRDAATPVRWLVRQYIGGANWGAQHRLDYLLRTQNITPPEKRPTAWVQNIALVVADPPWGAPVASAGWEKSLAIHHAWLDNLQRIADPDKLLFALRDWRTATGALDPYVVLMASRVRRLGYHVLLHLNGTAATEPHALVGEIVAALRATTADAVLLENPPAAERAFFHLLRGELDQNGMGAVALGVGDEPSEAALPFLDFFDGTDAALATLQRGSPAHTIPSAEEVLRRHAPFQAQIGLDALLTDEELQSFGLPPRVVSRPFTRAQFGTFALARFWGENQPRLLEPKFFEPGDRARYRLVNDRTLRAFALDANTLRLAYDNGEVLADWRGGDWTNNAALLDQYGPVFLKDKTEK
ncbi:MAG: hypothetical protein EPN23_03830 [Verrucomicrobia bacterium]|nr:MAG: hypothetical protein EPN23_03830 [Verrucomicrobiota bacterium]